MVALLPVGASVGGRLFSRGDLRRPMAGSVLLLAAAHVGLAAVAGLTVAVLVPPCS